MCINFERKQKKSFMQQHNYKKNIGKKWLLASNKEQMCNGMV